MEHSTREALTVRAAEKRAHQRHIRAIDQQLGRLARTALDEDSYTTKAALGRMLGISATAVANLIDGIEAPAGQDRMVVLDNTDAGLYVRKQGARIVRSISSFDDSDAWAHALIDPRDLYDEDGKGELPHVFWLLDTGEWVGVTNATVGYGGTGCGYTEQALIAAGTDPQAAHDIVSWRFCDARDITDPGTWTTSDRWPVTRLTAPTVTNGYLIARFGPALRHLETSWRRSEATVDSTGFYPSASEQTAADAWIALLDSPDCPVWAQGPRRARIFVDSEAAALQEYITHGQFHGLLHSPYVCPTVVIEQGDLQLWAHFDRPSEPWRLLSDETYAFLRLAGIETAELEDEDERRGSTVSRTVRSLLRTDRNLAPYFDVAISNDVIDDPELRHSPGAATAAAG